MGFSTSPTADDTIASFSSLEDKKRRLESVLAQPSIDLWELRDLALSEGGLVNGM